MPTTPRNPARAVRAAGAAVAALLVSSTIAFGVVPVYRQGVRNMAETERLRGQFAALDDLGRTLAQVEAERGRRRAGCWKPSGNCRRRRRRTRSSRNWRR